METVMISFFTHQDKLILRFELNKEISLPRRQPDYDGYVMAYWVENATPLMLDISASHITLTETLPDGTEYKLTF